MATSPDTSTTANAPAILPGGQTVSANQVNVGTATAPNIQTIPSTPPANANQVQPGPNVQLTTTNPPTGNTTNAQANVSSTQSYIDSATQLAKDQQAQDQALRDQVNNTASGQAQQGFLSKLLGGTSPDQAKQTAQQQSGIDPSTYFANEKAAIASINNLQGQYNTLNTQVQKQIAAIQGAGFGTTDFENNQVAQINRNAAPQLNEISANINAQTAVMNAQQGLFNQAQSFVNQAVQDATAMQKYNLDMFTALQTNNQQLFDQLDAPYKAAYTAQQNALQTQYQQSVQNTTDVLNLSIANPKAGILPTDTLAQATAKVNAAGGSLDYQLKKAQIAEANASAAKTRSEITNNNPVTINGPQAPTSYTLQAGDDPYNIAQQNGTDIATLKQFNPQIKDWNNIQPGVSLKLPPAQGSFLAGKTPQQVQAFNNIPDSDKGSIAQLVSGQALLTDIVKSRGAQTQAQINKIITEATSIDPTFSINKNKQQYAYQTQFNNPNGKEQLQINSINTGLGHLAEFNTAAQELNNGNILKGNQLKNYLSKNVGNSDVTNFETVTTALASELATIYKGGTAPSQTEIDSWKNQLISNYSTSQLAGVASTTANLISNKLSSLNNSYKNVMGTYPSQQIISPDAIQQLQSSGVDISSILSTLQKQRYNVSSSPATSGTLSSGLTYTVSQ